MPDAVTPNSIIKLGADAVFYFNERAAILEYDAPDVCKNRENAEAIAAIDTIAKYSNVQRDLFAPSKMVEY